MFYTKKVKRCDKDSSVMFSSFNANSDSHNLINKPWLTFIYIYWIRELTFWKYKYILTFPILIL